MNDLSFQFIYVKAHLKYYRKSAFQTFPVQRIELLCTYWVQSFLNSEPLIVHSLEPQSLEFENINFQAVAADALLHPNINTHPSRLVIRCRIPRLVPDKT